MNFFYVLNFLIKNNKTLVVQTGTKTISSILISKSELADSVSIPGVGEPEPPVLKPW